MANFPFFRPYSNYYHYYPHYNYPNVVKNDNQANEDEKTYESNKNDMNREVENKRKSSKYNSFGPFHFSNPLFNDIEEPIIEILGIQLYLDDIIILGLLFFLYNENVQDEILFLSLILLLLS